MENDICKNILNLISCNSVGCYWLLFGYAGYEGGRRLKVAIIDADLVSRKRHRFPNLACMKISGYHKECGDDVVLKTNYDELDKFDKVYISKVFTDTVIPNGITELPNIEYGGTGFFFDKSKSLPCEIEHHFPDYHLYDEWANKKIKTGTKRVELKYYLDYSIGFLTRGCFRQCPFCVNKTYTKVQKHSPLDEFLDVNRKKICLLDDNFLGYPKWKEMLIELQATGKPIQFNQGLDERLLTDEKCEILFKTKYDGDYTFAFDNIADAEIVEEKLKLIKKHTNIIPKFYLFTGFDRKDNWDFVFWRQDIIDLFTRIEMLMKYQCLPYVMRHERYVDSPYRTMYITIARWCNQPTYFKKKSFREYCNMPSNTDAARRYMNEFEKTEPEIAKRFYDVKYELMRNK